ncbi:flagellar hook-associated protein FlgL [Clostridium algidicarnis]|uniref:Flagellar hook-associated protein FlgL n=1 Tax=Clostridium algidicarnis TaxID=37659 RepID=A0ABS6BZ82_9CLOT|nr:flagellar hook-associated protein FlgL [Clostridium algidicarnis]MBU3218537.1 flagellar hook-associated protein FlgL [Clostridium algidicarnis]
MRVTNKMLSHNFLSDMRNNLNNMKRIQEQGTSGKQVRRPSDNPFKVSRIMQINSDIVANKQYNENIKDTINWLDSADTALGQSGEVFKRVRDLLVSAGNAAYGSSERKAIKDEVNEKIEEFSQILNTNFDGKYIFGGRRGTSKPMDIVKTGENSKLIYRGREGQEIDIGNDEYNMINSKLSVEVSQGVYIEYNVTATEITKFQNSKKEDLDIRKILSNITDHLDSDKPEDRDKLIGEDLQGVSDILDNILKLRSGVGAKQNRMESAKERNIEENFNMTEILSEVEDIDFTENSMESYVMQTVYMASLQASARIIQPTLMDYIR